MQRLLVTQARITRYRIRSGGYKFTDFVRVGVPLALIMWVGFSVVPPMFYDL